MYPPVPIVPTPLSSVHREQLRRLRYREWKQSLAPRAGLEPAAISCGAILPVPGDETGETLKAEDVVAPAL